MKQLKILKYAGLLLLVTACQDDGDINDTIDKDSVTTIRRPDDHTEVDKNLDTTPALKRDSLQPNNEKKDTTI